MAKPTVGFVGLGIMGRHMAGHILDAGYPMYVYNRSPAKADELVGRGAALASSPGELASKCDVIITIVGYPADVEEVYLGDDGLIARAHEGSTLIDMTTSSPALALKIADAASSRGLKALDAPISGGDVGAQSAKLAIMIGGDAAALNAVRPILELMGTNIAHLGGPGAGQHTKMANQIAIASTMMGVAESLAYAETAGLDCNQVLDVIGTGAASSFLLNGLGRKIVANDYSHGFFVHHFVKDMSIALTEAERMKLDLPGLKKAKQLYERLVAQGHGEEGTQAIYRLYRSTDGETSQ
ncbi:MAG: NAD(P)-dependent oxidoreductase [Rhodobacteraceae bacterium]|nr:NAD(P)-dependent oxidoreductase [Paracoccaceae bacterium]